MTEPAWDHSTHEDFYAYYAAESRSAATLRRRHRHPVLAVGSPGASGVFEHVQGWQSCLREAVRVLHPRARIENERQ